MSHSIEQSLHTQELLRRNNRLMQVGLQATKNISRAKPLSDSENLFLHSSNLDRFFWRLQGTGEYQFLQQMYSRQKASMQDRQPHEPIRHIKIRESRMSPAWKPFHKRGQYQKEAPLHYLQRKEVNTNRKSERSELQLSVGNGCSDF